MTRTTYYTVSAELRDSKGHVRRIHGAEQFTDLAAAEVRRRQWLLAVEDNQEPGGWQWVVTVETQVCLGGSPQTLESA
jgi:hypothetical protein